MFSNIQMMRAIAALLVVLHHSVPQYIAMNGTSSLIKHIAAWGFVGVDIFFVISGFVIAHTTINKKRNIGDCTEFLKHRFFRIFLGYWPFFFAAYAVTWVVLPGSLGGVNFIGSFFLISTSMNELLLPISWTLTYELYFYIFFAGLFAVRAETVKIIIPILFIAMLLITIFVRIDVDSLCSFLLSPFLLEFLSGSLLYFYRERLNSKWFILIGVVTSCFAFAYGVDADAKNGALRIYTFGLASFALVLTAIAVERSNIYKSNKYFKAIGDSSYTLYLSHLILIQIFYFSGIRTYLSGQEQWLIELGFFGFILFCLLFSYIFYRKIELPVYKWACSVFGTPMKVQRA